MTIQLYRTTDTTLSPDLAAEEQKKEYAWIIRCSEGDSVAIRWVLDKYRERVVRLAAHVLHNSREAEDVAQDAFVKAFRMLPQYRGDSSFYAWLYRIVVNLCLDRMRRKCVSSEIPLDEGLLVHKAAPDVAIDHKLCVEQVLNTLSPAMRAALVLREIEGLEYSEIAKVLGIPVGTVRSRLNSAREQFRQRWLAIQDEANHV